MALGKYAEDNLEIYLERMSMKDDTFIQELNPEQKTPGPSTAQNRQKKGDDNSKASLAGENRSLKEEKTKKAETLQCQDCCNDFVFTVKQQQSYEKRGWQAPIRCPSCRARKKEAWIANIEHRKMMTDDPMGLHGRYWREFFKKYGK